MFLTVDEVRDRLRLDDIDDSSLSDEDLNLLIIGKIDELQGLLGFDIVETSHKQYIRNYHDNLLILDYLNVLEVYQVLVNNKELCESEYTLDENLGILYFNNTQNGFLIIKYLCGLNETQLNTLIKPLLLDMITYKLDDNPERNATSIKEGDISIGYDTTQLLGQRINTRIQELRNSYTTKVRLI